MPSKCSVAGCRVYSKDTNYKLYRIPAVSHRSAEDVRKFQEYRRLRWLKNCHFPITSCRFLVCGRHFHSGQPAAFQDSKNIDWIPTLNLPQESRDSASNAAQILKYESDATCHRNASGLIPSPCSGNFNDTLNRSLNMSETSFDNPAANSTAINPSSESSDLILEPFPIIEINTSISAAIILETVQKNDDPSNYSWDTSGMKLPSLNSIGEISDIALNPSFVDENNNEQNSDQSSNITDLLLDNSTSYGVVQLDMTPNSVQNTGSQQMNGIQFHNEDITNYNNQQHMKSIKSDNCTQTEGCAEKEFQILKKQLARHEKTIASLSQLTEKLKLAKNEPRISVTCLENDDKKCKYFTGIASGPILRQIYNALVCDLPTFQELSKEQLLVLVLRKLRLNEPFCSLGYFYNLSPTTISEHFFETLNAIYPFLKTFVRFPARSVLKKHMPLGFQRKYGNSVTVIIDCFEVNMESPNPHAIKANANVFSFYKKHKTVKVLIGISPSGSILYVSSAFGGRISDKEIVKQSGFLEHLQEGDFIMADRGFLIESLVSPLNATVSYPAFKKKNHQLEPLDAVASKELSSLRIHVERLIGVLRQKFLVLTDTIPITLLQRWNNDTLAIDQILTVTSALVNLCPSVV